MDKIQFGSRDYIYVPIDAKLHGNPVTVAAQIAFTRPGDYPVEADWLPAVHQGKAVAHLMDGTLQPGTWVVRVRIVDNPTVPILKSGTIDVEG